MALVDRYLLAIFLNLFFDWLYYYALGTVAWHKEHIGTLWPQTAPPLSNIIRPIVFIIYYISFAAIFAAATAEMEVCICFFFFSLSLLTIILGYNLWRHRYHCRQHFASICAPSHFIYTGPHK